MTVKKTLIVAPMCMLLCIGCDTGDPEIDRRIGTAEVAAGKTLQIGGSVAVSASPEPATKVAGLGAVGVGAVLEANGEARIRRAEMRESESR